MTSFVYLQRRCHTCNQFKTPVGGHATPKRFTCADCRSIAPVRTENGADSPRQPGAVISKRSA